MFALIEKTFFKTIAHETDVQIIYDYGTSILCNYRHLPHPIPSAAIEVFNDTTVSVNGSPVPVPEGVWPKAYTPRYIVRFAGPIAAPWITALQNDGFTLHFWCPRFGACLSHALVESPYTLLGHYPFCVGAIPYEVQHCTRKTSDESALTTSEPFANFADVISFSRQGTSNLLDKFKEKNIAVVTASAYKIRIHTPRDLTEIRDIVGVKLADHPRPATLLAQPSIAPILEATDASGAWIAGLDGTGEIIALADTGLDAGKNDPTLHKDFRGRVVALESFPVNESWSGIATNVGGNDGAADSNSGHGTHVAGAAAGSGEAASVTTHRGVAPGARLVIQAIEQYVTVNASYQSTFPSGYYLSGRPLDLRTLFEAAKKHGATIHVNAWGDAASGRYTDDCYETDQFLKGNSDSLVLFAAGNDGTDTNGNRHIDTSSLYAPASAKNVLAIGAVEGPGTGIGYNGTWGTFDPSGRRFTHASDRSDPVSGEPNRIALFSSAGPTVDGRIKPDCCAPGTNIRAARSSKMKSGGWAVADPAPYYMYSGGTSVACGIAGGVAAVVRQAWRNHLGKAPSGPALKALLIMGCRPILGRGTLLPEERSSAGFGRITAGGSLPLQTGKKVVLFDEQRGLATGQTKSYTLAIGTNGFLRAVLTWYDVPGERLINDLDICARSGNQTIWGNHLPGESGVADRCNTVEVIDLPNAAAGTWELIVQGANIPEGPQPFALALTYLQSTDAQKKEIPPIPVEAISGIGPVSAQRLKDAGIQFTSELCTLDAPRFAIICLLSIKRATTFIHKIQPLKELATGHYPAAATSLTLQQVIDIQSPAVPSDGEWEYFISRIKPLTSLFGRRWLRKIGIPSLFVK